MGDQTVDGMLADAREVYSVFGKAQKALEIVDRALAKAPGHVEALNLRAAILYELDRDDEAADFHRQALAVEPCSIEALHGLASIANDRHEYQQALEWLERGFACIPEDPHPEFRENEDYRQRLTGALYIEKANALWYLGEREEAARLLTEDGPKMCPMELEEFESELEWLEEHPDSPDEE